MIPRHWTPNNQEGVMNARPVLVWAVERKPDPWHVQVLSGFDMHIAPLAMPDLTVPEGIERGDHYNALAAQVWAKLVKQTPRPDVLMLFWPEAGQFYRRFLDCALRQTGGDVQLVTPFHDRYVQTTFTHGSGRMTYRDWLPDAWQVARRLQHRRQGRVATK